ncbi:MAG: hypothetical protein IT196_05345 [Acidimicrobiales bacterium]|nr:hypothetical protein [Acidimicrobiales bacterium]
MQYQEATFLGSDGAVYDLAGEVAQHLLELILAEQREHEKHTGQRATLPRRRPDTGRTPAITRRQRPAEPKE